LLKVPKFESIDPPSVKPRVDVWQKEYLTVGPGGKQLSGALCPASGALTEQLLWSMDFMPHALTTNGEGPTYDEMVS